MSVTYDVRDAIAYIGFNRPEKHNAFRDEDLAALLAALRRFDVEAESLIAILFGHGPSFSSGGDVRARLQASMDEGSIAGRTTERAGFLECENWKPVVAAVHGYCLGHALSTALLCDHVVAGRDATFQVTETKIGLPIPNLVPRLGHPAFAHDVTMTGRFFTAEEAHAGGMLTRLVEPGTHVEGAETLARQILENPQPAVRAYVRLRRERIVEDAAREPRRAFDWTADEAARRAVADRAR